jgi:CBS domain-containing protein
MEANSDKPPRLQLTVSEIAVVNPLTLDSECSIKAAAEGMEKCGCGCCLVEKGGKVVGIITERDIVRRVVAKGLSLTKTKVKNIMSSPLIVVSPTTPIEEASKIMADRNVRRLPVVDDKGLKGIITVTDIARALTEKSNYANVVLDALARRNRPPTGLYA